MEVPYRALVACTLVVALTPILLGLLPRRARIPQVVVLLLGGVLIGPEALDLAHASDITLLSQLGLGFLFLLAGYELDPALFRQRVGRLAFGAWVSSLLVAVAVVAALAAIGLDHSPKPTAIALTTTALGTLLPVLRDNGLLGTRLGIAVLACGAVGELGPIVAMAVFLGSLRSGVELALVIGFAALALLLAVAPAAVPHRRVSRVVYGTADATTQTTLRLTVALLVCLLAQANRLGFDSVFGALLAGMVLRRWQPQDAESLEAKLDAVGWGVFIPLFFVSSGLGLDVAAMRHHVAALLVVFAALLVVRGGPVLAWYRRALPGTERVQLALLSATALPLLVALTELAQQAGTMTAASAATIIGAGVLSVLVFPYVALVFSRDGEPSASAGSASPAQASAGTATGDNGAG